MQRKSIVTLLFLCILRSSLLEAAACSSDEFESQQIQMPVEDPELKSLKKEANDNAIEFKFSLSDMVTSQKVGLFFYRAAAQHMSAGGPKSRDMKSFWQGAASTIALSIAGGAVAYAIKKNPQHIAPGLLAMAPYLFYNV